MKLLKVNFEAGLQKLGTGLKSWLESKNSGPDVSAEVQKRMKKVVDLESLLKKISASVEKKDQVRKLASGDFVRFEVDLRHSLLNEERPSKAWLRGSFNSS